MNGPRRFAHSSTVILGLWVLLAAIGLVRQNPLRVAKDAAVRSGGWSADQVEFQRGSFGFRGFYSVAEARLLVATDAGVRPVEIRLVHTPFWGWSVREFGVLAPCRDDAGHQTQRRVRARYSS